MLFTNLPRDLGRLRGLCTRFAIVSPTLSRASKVYKTTEVRRKSVTYRDQTVPRRPHGRVGDGCESTAVEEPRFSPVWAGRDWATRVGQGGVGSTGGFPCCVRVWGPGRGPGALLLPLLVGGRLRFTYTSRRGRGRSNRGRGPGRTTKCGTSPLCTYVVGPLKGLRVGYSPSDPWFIP